jgi:hypothetical protein
MKTYNSENQSKVDKPRKAVKIITVAFCVLVGLVLIYTVSMLLFFRFFMWPTKTVQVLYSSEYKHKAVLKRLDGIDLIFFVIVDGRKVYSSPDFAPNRKVSFREKIIWDKTSDIVILEVMGRRLFGYNAQTCKAISDAELLAIEYAPEPNDWEYGFEGTWPDEKINKEKRQH